MSSESEHYRSRSSSSSSSISSNCSSGSGSSSSNGSSGSSNIISNKMKTHICITHSVVLCQWLVEKAEAKRAGCRIMLLTILSRDCMARPGEDDTLALWWSFQK